MRVRLRHSLHPHTQEILQSKQQVFLGDLKRSLSTMKTETQKRIIDYQKEISAAEKDVQVAESKLTKSKDKLEKALEHRAKYVNNMYCNTIVEIKVALFLFLSCFYYLQSRTAHLQLLAFELTVQSV